MPINQGSIVCSNSATQNTLPTDRVLVSNQSLFATIVALKLLLVLGPVNWDIFSVQSLFATAIVALKVLLVLGPVNWDIFSVQSLLLLLL